MSRGKVRVDINEDAIAELMGKLQAGFDKHRIEVPIYANPNMPAPVTNYNGPTIVVNGDGVQIERVKQSQHISDVVAPGFEDLARLVTALLARLENLPLTEDDREIAREAGDQIVAEIAKPKPDVGVLSRAKRMLVGALYSATLAADAGANDGVREWVKTVVEHLSGAHS